MTRDEERIERLLGSEWARAVKDAMEADGSEKTEIDPDSGSTHEVWRFKDYIDDRPPCVLIGAQLFTINWDVKLKGLYGRASYRDGTIDIAKKQSKHAAQDTLLHEILHLLLANSGATLVDQLEIPDVDADELIVVTMTPRLLAVLRDNPEVTAWLLS